MQAPFFIDNQYIPYTLEDTLAQITESTRALPAFCGEISTHLGLMYTLDDLIQHDLSIQIQQKTSALASALLTRAGQGETEKHQHLCALALELMR